jgi:hypothetical protein
MIFSLFMVLKMRKNGSGNNHIHILFCTFTAKMFRKCFARKEK